MLVNCEGYWFTTNAYNFSRCSPLRKSLCDIDNDMKRREIIKKYFIIDASMTGPLCFLSYHGGLISSWSKGNKSEARNVIQAAVNMYIATGGK